MECQKKIRIYNLQTLDRMEILLGKGTYKSFNELANAALDIGVDMLYTRIFEPSEYSGGADKASNSDKLSADKLNAIITGQDEMSVNIAIVKSLLQILYSIWVSRNSGAGVSQEEIDCGLICDMPKFLKEVESDLIKAVRRRV